MNQAMQLALQQGFSHAPSPCECHECIHIRHAGTVCAQLIRESKEPKRFYEYWQSAARTTITEAQQRADEIAKSREVPIFLWF
jgi:hypothetical protein